MELSDAGVARKRYTFGSDVSGNYLCSGGVHHRAFDVIGLLGEVGMGTGKNDDVATPDAFYLKMSHIVAM